MSDREMELCAVAGAAAAAASTGRGGSSGTCKAYFSTLLPLPLSWKINCKGSSRQDNDNDNPALQPCPLSRGSGTCEPSWNNETGLRRWEQGDMQILCHCVAFCAAFIFIDMTVI